MSLDQCHQQFLSDHMFMDGESMTPAWTQLWVTGDCVISLLLCFSTRMIVERQKAQKYCEACGCYNNDGMDLRGEHPWLRGEGGRPLNMLPFFYSLRRLNWFICSLFQKFKFSFSRLNFGCCRSKVKFMRNEQFSHFQKNFGQHI